MKRAIDGAARTARMGALIAIAIAAGGGCGRGAPVGPASQVRTYAGTLDADIRYKAAVSIGAHPDGAADIRIQLDDASAAGLTDPKVPLVATGRVEPFPETASELFTAKIPLPAFPAGPCGTQPISLAFALHRRGNDLRFGGALTAYCGDNHYYGTPATMLRLAGELQLQ